MTFDRIQFAARLKKSRDAFGLTIAEVQQATALNMADLEAYEEALSDPKGDHVLILADFFRCDYRYFVDPAWPDVFGNTSMLFRANDSDLSKDDRLAVQETLLLCENESFLQGELGLPIQKFSFKPEGSYFKGHGQAAAAELRQFLGYEANALRLNLFDDLRKIGLHVFRRRLKNEKISGIFIRHATAGKCVIVNYDEDFFRQRFTGAHEAGHAILDTETSFNLSLEWGGTDLKEIRANTFASFFLIPSDFARRLPDPQAWTRHDIISWATKLMLSTHALAIGLRQHGLIDDRQFNAIRAAKVPKETKSDPELPASLSPARRAAKQEAIERGLSEYYVGAALEAFKGAMISRGRLCEMLLCDERDLNTVGELFGRTLTNVH